MTELDFFF